MPPFKIARFCRKSLHATRRGGLPPASTHLAGVPGTRLEVHFFARGDRLDRSTRGVFTVSACLRGRLFLITAMI